MCLVVVHEDRFEGFHTLFEALAALVELLHEACLVDLGCGVVATVGHALFSWATAGNKLGQSTYRCEE